MASTIARYIAKDYFHPKPYDIVRGALKERTEDSVMSCIGCINAVFHKGSEKTLESYVASGEGLSTMKHLLHLEGSTEREKLAYIFRATDEAYHRWQKIRDGLYEPSWLFRLLNARFV